MSASAAPTGSNAPLILNLRVSMIFSLILRSNDSCRPSRRSLRYFLFPTGALRFCFRRPSVRLHGSLPAMPQREIDRIVRPDVRADPRQPRTRTTGTGQARQRVPADAPAGRSFEAKKKTCSNTSRYSSTSAYLLAGLPAQPSCQLISHPTNIRSDPSHTLSI